SRTKGSSSTRRIVRRRGLLNISLAYTPFADTWGGRDIASSDLLSCVCFSICIALLSASGGMLGTKGSGDRNSVGFWIKINTKGKRGGQECPPYTSYLGAVRIVCFGSSTTFRTSLGAGRRNGVSGPSASTSPRKTKALVAVAPYTGTAVTRSLGASFCASFCASF